MEVSAAGATAWHRGRLDARAAPSELLFGHMHEDCSIELGVFPVGSRVFSIASAGCTAMALARGREVVAVDVNPVQVAYARERFSGGPISRGAAERLIGFGRALAPLVGWRRSRVREFLDLDEPSEQVAFWRHHLNTRRFRAAMTAALSRAVLGLLYAPALLECVPNRFGTVMRGRLERGFARHSNRDNPYARAFLLGEHSPASPSPEAKEIQLVQADAADFLERAPAGSFDGFTLSNVLDGADPAYRRRLSAAVARAAAPGALMVVRSFAEPATPSASNRAAEDRAMIWGKVEVQPAAGP